MSRLSQKTLAMLAPQMVFPRYPRSAAEHRVVHLGLGNFHRAHQAWYLDQLRSNGDLSWSMRGASLLPGDAALLTALGEQDGLYCLTEKATSGEIRHRVIGSIEAVLPPGDLDLLAAWLADPVTALVTLTITEGGYLRQAATGHIDPQAPEPAADAALERPSSVFGFIARALAARRAAGTAPFTVLSCDNLIDNGVAAREAVAAFAAALDPDLGSWVASEVAFPNSMVDGITPAATSADRDQAAAALGVRDECTVTCEPFRQWVIEDRFPTGRPRWEKAGALLVNDVAPYERMKLRLLNAGHQVLGCSGALAGFRHIHDVAQDPDLGGLLEVFWADEARPQLEPPPGVDLVDYCRVLRDRFSNPGIADPVARIAAQASDRVPTFVLPTLEANLATGGSIDCAAFVLAAWARYLLGRDDNGEPLDPVDDRLATLLPLVQADPELPLGLLDHPVLASVGSQPRLRTAFATFYRTISTIGAQAAARTIVDNRNPSR